MIFHGQKWFEDDPHLNDRKVLRLFITIGVELSYIVLQVEESSFVPSSYHKCPTSSHLGHEKQRVAYVYNGTYMQKMSFALIVVSFVSVWIC